MHVFCTVAVGSAHGAQHSIPQTRSARLLASAQPKSRLAYVLLGSGTRNDLLSSILNQLRDHLLPWTPGDVLFFHTGEYDKVTEQALITSVLPDAKILRIPEEAWTLPEGMHEEDAPTWWYADCCPFPMHGIGYRHMCRWYSNGLFHYLHKLGYEWVLRLDEDSEVLSPATTNLVDWMEANGKQYGFRLWDYDDTEVTWSLPEITAWYITAHELEPVGAPCTTRWMQDGARTQHKAWRCRCTCPIMCVPSVLWLC